MLSKLRLTGALEIGDVDWVLLGLWGRGGEYE